MSRIKRKENYLVTNEEALATDEAIYRETEDLNKESNQLRPPKDFHKLNFRFDQQDSARPSMQSGEYPYEGEEEDKEDNSFYGGARGTTVRRDFDHEDPNVQNEDNSGYGVRKRKLY
jgi:hypothetical protein